MAAQMQTACLFRDKPFFALTPLKASAIFSEQRVACAWLSCTCDDDAAWQTTQPVQQQQRRSALRVLSSEHSS
jgi:hypothetical protein